MDKGSITQYIDVAQVVLYLFWIFFAGLIFYLQRETRREGYPLESDTTGEVYNTGWIFMPEPKTFKLAGGKEVTVPNDIRETRKLALERTAVWDGSPYEPTGKAMTSGVGPASYAERADEPDRTSKGEPRIQPISKLKGYSIAEEDPDPRGMDVVGIDDEVAGKIVDVWVDKSEHIIRYLQVEIPNGDKTKKVLVPMTFCAVQPSMNRVYVDSITSDQFADVPTTRKAGEITLLEEDKISGYYGGGTLWAWAKRSEPLL